jgi:hypothetical protein
MNKKTLIVDLDDISDLKANITFLQKKRKNLLQKLGYTHINFMGSKTNIEKILPIIEEIYLTDISNLYKEKDNLEKYYVYLHCDTTKPLQILKSLKDYWLAIKFKINYQPFYVGKGTGNRYLDTNRNDSYRKIKTNIEKSQKEISIIKIKENISEIEALSIESKLIDILGLKALSQEGYLVNLDEGFFPIERRKLYNYNNGWIDKILIKNGFKIPNRQIKRLPEPQRCLKICKNLYFKLKNELKYVNVVPKYKNNEIYIHIKYIGDINLIPDKIKGYFIEKEEGIGNL